MRNLLTLLVQFRRPQFNSWVGKIRWRKDRLPAPVFLGFPCGSVGKESACNARRPRFDPWVGKIPWRRESYPLQYSGLEKAMDYTIYGVTKSQTGLSSFTSVNVAKGPDRVVYYIALYFVKKNDNEDHVIFNLGENLNFLSHLKTLLMKKT